MTQNPAFVSKYIHFVKIEDKLQFTLAAILPGTMKLELLNGIPGGDSIASSHHQIQFLASGVSKI